MMCWSFLLTNDGNNVLQGRRGSSARGDMGRTWGQAWVVQRGGKAALGGKPTAAAVRTGLFRGGICQRTRWSRFAGGGHTHTHFVTTKAEVRKRKTLTSEQMLQSTGDAVSSRQNTNRTGQSSSLTKTYIQPAESRTHAHARTRTRTHTHNGNPKREQSKKAVKENSSGAAGQPSTSFDLLGTAQCAALVSADAMQY